MPEQAVIVLDMVNDFVTGALACDRAERIIPYLQDLFSAARTAHVPVIFVNDAHLPDDFEIDLWGEHAMHGSEGAEVIPELPVDDRDYVLEKRTYSGFYDTGLDQLLRSLGVETLLITGLHTNMCCRHTSADAYFRGYDIVAVSDGCQAFSQEEHEEGLRYLEKVYGAAIQPTDEITSGWT
ncbi:MAG: isochorismatase family protein [Bacteroidetes bacterium]|jgi:nicotinamidase-related amidase|nr:isochorismatase family protein [Bacteroidota bacterium]